MALVCGLCPQYEVVQELDLFMAGLEGSTGKAILTETIQLGQCKLREGSGRVFVILFLTNQ